MGAALVTGRAQIGGSDVVETGLFDAGVEDAQQRLLVLPLRHDLVVDEGGEHLRLDEAGQEREEGLGLIGQERGLEHRQMVK